MKSCLQCGKEFNSTGRFNRICKTCKKQNKQGRISYFKTCFSENEIKNFLMQEENLYFKENFIN